MQKVCKRESGAQILFWKAQLSSRHVSSKFLRFKSNGFIESSIKESSDSNGFIESIIKESIDSNGFTESSIKEPIDSIQMDFFFSFLLLLKGDSGGGMICEKSDGKYYLAGFSIYYFSINYNFFSHSDNNYYLIYILSTL